MEFPTLGKQEKFKKEGQREKEVVDFKVSKFTSFPPTSGQAECVLGEPSVGRSSRAATPSSSQADLVQRFSSIPIIDSLQASNDDVRKLLTQSFSATDGVLKSHMAPDSLHPCA